MTVKVFRDAYLAARFLEAHDAACSACTVWAARGSLCPQATAARAAQDRADALLEIANTREARKQAWLNRSPSRR